MDEKTKALIGALADLFPPDLTVEELHDFTGAPIGACVHVLREVRELRLREQLEWVDGISSEIVRRGLELLPRAA